MKIFAVLVPVLFVGSFFAITSQASDIKVAVQCNAFDPVQYGTLKFPIEASEWTITEDPQSGFVCNLGPVHPEVVLTVNQLVYTGKIRSIPLDKPNTATCAQLNPVNGPISNFDKYNKFPSVEVKSQFGADGDIGFTSSTFDVFIDTFTFMANTQHCAVSVVP